jgi:hypothetical protein
MAGSNNSNKKTESITITTVISPILLLCTLARSFNIGRRERELVCVCVCAFKMESSTYLFFNSLFFFSLSLVLFQLSMLVMVLVYSTLLSSRVDQLQAHTRSKQKHHICMHVYIHMYNSYRAQSKARRRDLSIITKYVTPIFQRDAIVKIYNE